MEKIIEQLKTKLKWRNDSQKSASDGKYVLIATFGDSETLYVLLDENDTEVKKWKE
jgi:hypothetical protein